MNKLIVASLILASGLAQAADQLNGDVLVRSMSVNQRSLVLYKNPNGASAHTMVFCTGTEQFAKELLGYNEMGGVILMPNSKVVFKNDNSRTFTDGSKLSGQFIQFECK